MLDSEWKKRLNELIDEELEEHTLGLTIGMFELRKTVVRSVADAVFGFIIGVVDPPFTSEFVKAEHRPPDLTENAEITEIIRQREEEIMEKILAAL